jgi:hypothetical protein
MATQVIIELPDDVAQELANGNGGGLQQAILEMVALEGYRSERLTHAEVMRLLGFDHRLQVDAFLKEHGVSVPYTTEELEEQLQTLAALERR